MDGTAVLVDVYGLWWRRWVLLITVGQARFGNGDVLDWGGLAVVWWLVVMVWARLWVRRLVFVDDAVARRGAYGVRGVFWCRGGRRGG